MAVKTGLKCTTCGGDLSRNDDGILVCDYCGHTYPIDFAGAQKSRSLASDLVQNLNEAQNLHMLARFDDAAEIYEAIIQKYPKEILAYWGAFIAEYGVQYTEHNGKFEPVCHRISRIPATDSQYLKKLYSLCANDVDRQTYRKKADLIEIIRSRAYEISIRQEPYDVFICHSGSGREPEYASQLFSALEEKGFKVFMPQKSVPYGEDEEAYTFSAIQSAEYMLVIAESISGLQKTNNTWGRFVALPDKNIQVLHAGLNESEFPLKLRRKVQYQKAPVNLNAYNWLQSALDFVKKTEKGAGGAVNTDEIRRLIEEQAAKRSREIDNIVHSMVNVANNIDDAFIAMLSTITTGDSQRADMLLVSQVLRFRNGENGETDDLGGVQLVAELCVELSKLAKSSEAERRNIFARISHIAGRLKGGYPVLSEKERKLYPVIKSVKRAALLLYLAKSFGAIKDFERQCFVLDLIDYDMPADLRETNEYIAMLFSVGREEDVREFLRTVHSLDGNKILPLILEKFSLGSQKQLVLLSIADKITCTGEISDDLNSYLSDCDDLGVALAVADIMTNNNIGITPVGLGGVLSKVKEAEQVKRIIANYGKRPLSGLEVDLFVSIGTNSDEVANEVLRYLRYDAGVADLGAHNMRLLINKCNLENIKTNLFEFVLDKKLAEDLFIETVRGNGADRLSTISILSSFVPVVDIQSYAATLLGRDELKKEILKTIAPKTGKFASANKVIEQFLSGDDYDEDKREIFEMFGDFPFSEKALSQYLSLCPDSYYPQYEKLLFKYLDEHPENARTIFAQQYERLIGGYEQVLPRILGYIKFMDNSAVVRFVLDFKGEQSCKDELFLKMIDFLTKPKNIEVNANGAECNLVQAYLLTMRQPSHTTQRVVAELRKAGLKPDEKVVSYNKKFKMNEYVNNSDLKPEIINEINKYLK